MGVIKMTREQEIYRRPEVQAQIGRLSTVVNRGDIQVTLHCDQKRLDMSYKWKSLQKDCEAFIRFVKQQNLILNFHTAIVGIDRFKSGYPHVNMILCGENNEGYSEEMGKAMRYIWTKIQRFEEDTKYRHTFVNEVEIEEGRGKIGENKYVVEFSRHNVVQYLFKRAPVCRRNLKKLGIEMNQIAVYNVEDSHIEIVKYYNYFDNKRQNVMEFKDVEIPIVQDIVLCDANGLDSIE